MDLLPLATQSASQTLFVTTTGVEKAFTLIGIGTITVLALFGLLTIVRIMVKNSFRKHGIV